MKGKNWAWATSILVLAGSPLFAQPGMPPNPNGGPPFPGVPGFGRGRGQNMGPVGANSLEGAASAATQTNRVIAYYVYNPEDPYSQFMLPGLRQIIQANVVWFGEPFSIDNEAQKGYGVRSAPTIVALDKYLNDLGLRMTNLPAIDKFMAFVRDAQAAAKNLEVQIKAIAKAIAEHKAKGETAKAMSEVTRLLAMNKKGYPEIEVAKSEADSLVEAELAKARVYLSKPETEKQGLQMLDGIRTIFRGLPQAMRGDLEAAQFLLKKGMISAAYTCLSRVTHADAKMYQADIDKAKEINDQIVKEGIDAIRSALMVGVDGDLDSAKEKIGKVQKDYSSCRDVAKHASEVMADLQR